MNVLILKIIALISMIIDHYGAIFHNDVEIYRIVGRIAFPIYCFLLVEGYTHTRNVKKYASRLLLFALISELPFDLAFYGSLGFEHQNVFFTLFIGLVLMHLLDNKEGKYNFNKNILWLLGGLLAMLTYVDYSFIGIIYILAFYYTKDYKNPEKLYRVALIIFLTNLISAGLKQQFALLSLPLIYFYNGKPGPKNKFLQLLFYIAYPLHLLLFYIFNTSI